MTCTMTLRTCAVNGEIRRDQAIDSEFCTGQDTIAQTREIEIVKMPVK